MENNDVIPHISVNVDENDVINGAQSILEVIRPHWSKELINFKLFTDGITNKLVGCFYNPGDKSVEEVVLVRVYGVNTDLLIDRDLETRNIKLLHDAGHAPCLFATFQNGLAYEYVPGDTLTVESVRLPSVWKLVAREMARIHLVDCGSEVTRKPMLYSKSQRFMDLVPNVYDDFEIQKRYCDRILPITELRIEFDDLYDTLKRLGSPIVFAHNDLLLGNVIYDDRRNKVTFIDYEYACYNYQGFDIGNHFAEFVGLDTIDYSKYPSKQFQLSWLREYLQVYTAGNKGDPDETEVDTADVLKLYAQVNKFALAAHFFWGIWSLIQAQHSRIDFDFIGYAEIRFKEYFDRKEEFLSIEPTS